MPNISSHKDFIGLYENALSASECEQIINEFELFSKEQEQEVFKGAERYNGELNRTDFSVFANLHFPDTHNLIASRLHECLTFYCDHYFMLKGMSAASLEVKIQKTPPRGGYHVWHCEQDAVDRADRVLVWTIYLNDIPYNEGETEFLWQGIRVNPKAGLCAIWPAAFTHFHRGNPVYTHSKYIATGWYTLI